MEIGKERIKSIIAINVTKINANGYTSSYYNPLLDLCRNYAENIENNE
jgi:hypothetical protein